MEGTNVNTTAPTTAPAKVKKVSITIPIVPGVYEEDVIIGINGVNYQIPRGKPQMVPEFVAKEYERSQKAAADFLSNAKKKEFSGAINAGQNMY